MTTTRYGSHLTPPSMDSFVSHLATLLALYDLGPQPFTQARLPQYDFPVDLRTDAILASISTMVHRMRAAEEALEKHSIKLDTPKWTTIPTFSPSHGGKHVHGDPPREGDCHTCPCGKATSDPIAEELKLLKAQVQDVTRVCNAIARGDLSQMVTIPAEGVVIVQLKDIINTMVVGLRGVVAEVTRVNLEIGTRGKLGSQAHVPGVEGVWLDLVRNVNQTSSSLADQARSISNVATAVARGDLTQKIEIDMEGEMLTLKGTVNSMVDQLSGVASEVTRGVQALQVGTQGMLGGQSRPELQGTWADLTRNLNKMTSNVTDLVRSVAEVTKAVERGVLSKQINVEVQGDMLDLKLTVNSMVNRLRTLACELSRISLEVGVEGILGGKASVPNVQGMWKLLIDDINVMSMNLADQVRSVNEVTKAVAGGDLTKRVEFEVDARGEILELKETVNAMTESLSDTTLASDSS